MTRRTSQYTLTIPAPEHTDADLQAALDALVAALPDGTVCQGSYLTRAARGDHATLSVAYRAAGDVLARILARDTLTAYAAAPVTAAGLHTGYGAHRRDFPVIVDQSA